MGVVIVPYKILREVAKDDKSVQCKLHLYNSDLFEEIEHLTVFHNDSYYEYCPDAIEKAKIVKCTYVVFNEFRNLICQAIFNKTYDDVYDEIIHKAKFDIPFIELLYFGDNTGCFDYKIAEKIFDNFITYMHPLCNFFKDKNEVYNDILNDYVTVLGECIKYKGIIMYR